MWLLITYCTPLNIILYIHHKGPDANLDGIDIDACTFDSSTRLVGDEALKIPAPLLERGILRTRFRVQWHHQAAADSED